MEKNPIVYSSCIRKKIKIIFLTMKLLSILIFAGSMAVSASTYSQRTKIDLQFENSSLTEILSSIERNSEFIFVYNANLVNSDIKRSISVKGETIEKVLSILFEGVNVTYQIDDRQVFLHKKEELKNLESINEGVSGDQNQKKSITGKVTDEKGVPIPGVSVVVKGTTTGVTTDNDGNYSILLPNNVKILSFSFIGMTSQDIIIGIKNTISVILTEKATGIDEVLIIGYGTRKKSEITGAISSVKAAEFKSAPLPNVASVLQGRAAGVQVVNQSGSPGAGIMVRIRGTGSLNTSNQPLYVIDGVPVSNINNLNVGDVESIEVLKDASSSAIYGISAANGVVLITTKKGTTSGRTNVEFDSYLGTSSPWKMFDMFNAEQYMTMRKRALYDASPNPNIRPEMVDVQKTLDYVERMTGSREGTDFYKEMKQFAPIQNYQLAVTGGNEQTTYRISTNYFDQKGIFKSTGYNRLSMRANLTTNIAKWLKFSANLSYTTDKKQSVKEWDDSPFNDVIYSDPLQPVYRTNLLPTDAFYQQGIVGYNPNDPYTIYGSSFLKPWTMNPVGLLFYQKDNWQKQSDLRGLFAVDADIFAGLSFRSSIGLGVSNGKSQNMQPQYIQNELVKNTSNTLTVNMNEGSSYTFENYFTYKKKFGLHDISIMAGMTASESWNSDLNGSRKKLPYQDQELLLILNQGTQIAGTGGGKSWGSSLAYMSRLGYIFNEKYITSASVRREGTPKFGASNRWGNFYALSAGWRFTKERFFQQLGLTWFSEGKIRGAWGQIGNSGVPSGATFTQISNTSIWGNQMNYPWGVSESTQYGYLRTNVANPSLKWETNVQIDGGIDLGFFDNSLTLTIDYFNRRSKDLLMQSQPPRYTGIERSIWVNMGEIENKGIEIELDYRRQVGNTFLTGGINFSKMKNKVISLANSNYFDWWGMTRTQVGSPVGSFRGFIMDGIFQSEEQINESAQLDNAMEGRARPGDFIYRDIDGNKKIDNQDQVLIGNPIPDFLYSFNLGVEWKGIDFGLFFEGSQGNDIFQRQKVYRDEGPSDWVARAGKESLPYR